MYINYVHKIKNVSNEEFDLFQKDLKNNIVISHNTSLDNIRFIAGIDIAYDIVKENEAQMGHCSVIVFKYPSLEIVEKQEYSDFVECDYIPGMLAKKELPLLIKALEKVETDFDVLLVDGNGILHQLGIGSASHLSFFINKPTIGIGKKFYNFEHKNYEQPGNNFGDYTELINKENTLIGYAINGSKKSGKHNPIFMSPGNNISFKQAYDLIITTIQKESKFPYPVRMADIESRVIRERYKNERKFIRNELLSK